MPKIDRFGELPTTRTDRRIDSAGIADGSAKLVLYDLAASRAPDVIAVPCGPDAEGHFNSLATISPGISSVGVYSLRACELRNLAFLFMDGKLVDEPDLIPEYVRHSLDTSSYWDVTSDLPVRTIDGVSLVTVSVVHGVYGHWILDILPRVWLAKLLLEDISKLNFIVPHGTPAFAIRILKEFFGIAQMVTHDFVGERLRLEHALVPSLLHNDHYFHPAMNDFVAYLLAHPLVVEARGARAREQKLIYVTRQGFRNTSQSYARTIVNENDVLALMDELGFQVVSPETMCWQDQIVLFAGARVIVGEAGSGLHNTLFSGASAAVVCLNPMNQVQSSIDGLRGHTVIFQCSPAEDINATTSYRVDINRLREAALAAMRSTGETFHPPPIEPAAPESLRERRPEDSTPSFRRSLRPSTRLAGMIAWARDTGRMMERALAALFRR